MSANTDPPLCQSVNGWQQLLHFHYFLVSALYGYGVGSFPPQMKESDHYDNLI